MSGRVGEDEGEGGRMHVALLVGGHRDHATERTSADMTTKKKAKCAGWAAALSWRTKVAELRDLDPVALAEDLRAAGFVGSAPPGRAMPI